MSSPRGRRLRVVCVVAAAAVALAAGCEREERDVHVDPAAANLAHGLRLSELQPGTTRPSYAHSEPATDPATAPATEPATGPATAAYITTLAPTHPWREAAGAQTAQPADYGENAFALAAGKRLFTMFNCVGCHGNGGGGMGPPLMDDEWLYGHEPQQVFATIIQGRPNGMPSFGGHIPDYQVWQLAQYVRSMSGLVRVNAAPGRTDHMKNKPPENSVIRPPSPPKSSPNKPREMPS